MELVVAKAKLPLPQAFAGMKQLEADLAARTDEGSALSRVRNPLTMILMSPPTLFFTAVAQGTAANDTADVALAVEQHRRRHGKLPQQLDELVHEFLPSVPNDAFDGQPLRYVVRADGYVVYSVSEDLIDQGGVKGPRPIDPGDVTFEVKRAWTDIND
jgi:hypothetical protein